MSVVEFLKNLPSHDKRNFSRYKPDSRIALTARQAPIYLPTREIPSDQVIVTERTHILFKAVNDEWAKNIAGKKNKQDNMVEESNPQKRPRYAP